MGKLSTCLPLSMMLGLVAGCGDNSRGGEAAVAVGAHGGEIRTEVLTIPGLATQPITYEWVDGKAFFEGDIELDLDRLRKADTLGRSLQAEGTPGDLALQTVGRSNESTRWPNGVVPYTINGDPNATISILNGSPETTGTSSGMYRWSGRLPQIQFVRRTTESAYVNFVTGTAGTLCSSNSIGRNGGVVTVTLQTGCMDQITIAHELGHALGLFHEMSRSDRDNWITVNWSNLSQPDQYKTYIERGLDGFDNHSFDFASIMLYGPDAFAKDKTKHTATRKDGTVWPSPPKVLSNGDYQAMGRMYPRFSDFTDGSQFVQTVSQYGPGVTSWGPGRLDVVAVADNGNIIHQYYDNGTWSGWVDNFGGVATTAVDVTSWGPNRLDLVTRGTDNQVWHFYRDTTVPGQVFSGWEPMGLQTLYGPTICSEENGSLDIWAVGTDGLAYSRGFRGGAGGWRPNWIQSIPGTVTAGIDCVASRDRNDVVSRNAQNHVVYSPCTGACTNWQDLGGVIFGRPTIASWQPGHYDVFGQGTDFNVYKRSLQGAWNTGWGYVGGIGYVPDAVSWGVARIDMVVRNPRSIVGWGNVQN
jgi:Astacin (Peptidase family M12A)